MGTAVGPDGSNGKSLYKLRTKNGVNFSGLPFPGIEMDERVLVTDGDYRQALAITRSLGRKGITVDVMSHFSRSIAFHSRYCSGKILTNPPGCGGEFGDRMLDQVYSGEYRLLLPVGLEANMEASRIRDRLERHVSVPVPDAETMERAARKDLCIEVADEAGVPAPRTLQPSTLRDAVSSADALGFPVVVKAVIGSGGGGVRIARSPEEFRESYLALDRHHSRPLVQEYVPGSGYGYSALAEDGKPLAEVSHMRIHELPPEGGPSTMARSLDIPVVKEMGRKILRQLGWTGVAMVEFRGPPGRSGSDLLDFKLIEINPKFWGSLDLAVAAGVDFPYLTYLKFTGRPVEPVHSQRDVTFRWIYTDLVYALETGQIAKYLINYLRPSVKSDLDMDDPGPLACTLRKILGEAHR